MNMYAYVGNDPVNATDPSGKTAGTITAGGCAVGAALGCAVGAVVEVGLLVGCLIFCDDIIRAALDPLLNESDDGTTPDDTKEDARGIGDNGGPPLDDPGGEDEDPKGDDERGPQLGDRAKSGDDKLQKLEEMENRQRKIRRGTSGGIMDDITKTKQRAKHQLKRYDPDFDEDEEK